MPNEYSQNQNTRYGQGNESVCFDLLRIGDCYQRRSDGTDTDITILLFGLLDCVLQQFCYLGIPLRFAGTKPTVHRYQACLTVSREQIAVHYLKRRTQLKLLHTL